MLQIIFIQKIYTGLFDSFFFPLKNKSKFEIACLATFGLKFIVTHVEYNSFSALSSYGFSAKLAVQKINIYPICNTSDKGSSYNPVGIALSRVTSDGEYQTQGAWIISPFIDKKTGWDSLALIAQRLNEGADDFYILNFTKLKEQIDLMIDTVRG